MPSPTIRDIAKAAGVGPATVDRVLNGRGNPNPSTVSKVHQAIKDLGYKPNLAAASLRRGRPLKIGVVLPSVDVGFLAGLAANIPKLDEEFAAKGVTIELVVENTTDPLILAESLRELKDQFDGLMVLAPADPAIYDAIDHLETDGVRVAAIVSDLPQSKRSLFSGPNNHNIGATAAQIVLPSASNGTIIVVKVDALQDDIEARALGFFKTLVANGIAQDKIKVVSIDPTAEPETISPHFNEVCEKEKLGAVYLTGGRTRDIIGAVLECFEQKPLIVATDLTPSSRELTINKTIDFIVSSDSERQLRDGIAELVRCVAEKNMRPGNINTPINIYTRFNLPSAG